MFLVESIKVRHGSNTVLARDVFPFSVFPSGYFSEGIHPILIQHHEKMQKYSPCIIILFLIKECFISARQGVWKEQVMMSLVLIFKCQMLISLWLSFQLFIVLPNSRCSS